MLRLYSLLFDVNLNDTQGSIQRRTGIFSGSLKSGTPGPVTVIGVGGLDIQDNVVICDYGSRNGVALYAQSDPSTTTQILTNQMLLGDATAVAVGGISPTVQPNTTTNASYPTSQFASKFPGVVGKIMYGPATTSYIPDPVPAGSIPNAGASRTIWRPNWPTAPYGAVQVTQTRMGCL